GELQEHALAFRLLEAVAVFLEEAVRPALAADADEQRLAIAEALALELLGARREQAVGGAFEKEKRRLPLDVRIGGDQLTVACFQRAEVFLLLAGELL